MENLKHLVSGYFYELWNAHEYESWEQAVDDFIRRSPDRASATPQEIDQLLSTPGGDPRVTEQLDAWGFNYLPPEGTSAWLSAVRDRILRKTLA
jgi:CdiI immunity protein